MLLSACSSNYQALESGSISGGGYQERLLSETEFSLFESNEPELGTPEQSVRYWLLYQGTNFDTQARIHIFWQQRAQELCYEHGSDGYQVVEHQQRIKHGTMRSPVNGSMQTLGTQQPMESGIITCY